MMREDTEKYLEENLKMIGDGPICESVINAIKWFADINCSQILSKLIKEAGSICESYASDLFISWDTIRSEMDELMKKNKGKSFVYTYYFGFRNMGVDSAEFIASRMQSPEMYGRPYKKIYKLDFVCDDGGYWPEGVYDVNAYLYLVYVGGCKPFMK